MLWYDISKILGYFLLYFGLTLLFPLGLSVYYEVYSTADAHPQPHATIPFLESFVISVLAAFLLIWIGRRATGNIYRREGLALVVFIWFLAPAFAALPFTLSGTLQNPTQAYFEAVSGLTTTGATVMWPKKYDEAGKEIPIEKVVCGSLETTYTFWGNITPVRDDRNGEIVYEGVEAVGKAILFWRSLLQWIGGVGIILLFASILPALGVGGKVLLQAEQTGPLKSSLTPRLKETAAHLWKIYFGLTVLQIILLMLTNDEMPLFDAVTITFSTLSTGGFSIKNASIGFYQNAWTEWIVIIFMILGSINFTLYFYALAGKFYRIYDLEFFLFLAILFSACALGAFLLIGTPEDLLTGVSKNFEWEEAIRIGTFQIVSANTSTGFAVANYDRWPHAVQALLLIVMFVGGMSGSTAGGIKIIRHYILFRIAQYRVESLFRPENIRNFRIGDRALDNSSAIMVLCFFLVVVASAVFGTYTYILTGVDPETSIGCVACMLNNTGAAFRVAGPAESFAFMSNFNLVFSSILMILGRLEYFAVLAILVPAFWKQK